MTVVFISLSSVQRASNYGVNCLLRNLLNISKYDVPDLCQQHSFMNVSYFIKSYLCVGSFCVVCATMNNFQYFYISNVFYSRTVQLDFHA